MNKKLKENIHSSNQQLKTMLMTTCRKYGRYIDQCVGLMDYCWPGHPEIWVISDADNFAYKNSVIIGSEGWVLGMKESIGSFMEKNILDADDYILLLCEDHIPMRKVPVNLLKMLFEYSFSNKLDFLAFTGHGRDEKIYEKDGIGIYEIRKDFRYYSELHPAIWRVGHFFDILSIAYAEKRLSIWDFECTRKPGVTHHTACKLEEANIYFSGPLYFLWPCTFGGFLGRGFVRKNALRQMTEPAYRQLRKLLLRDFIFRLPKYTFLYIRQKIRDSFNKILKQTRTPVT